MIIKDFVELYKTKNIKNTKTDNTIVSNFLTKELEIKKYIPFQEKRAIAEMVVAENTEIVDGVKKNNPIDQYLSFVMSMLIAHTNLEASDNPIDDYDMLAESGLLPLIISEFQESYNETDVLLKMALASELEYNNMGAMIGRFLDGILNKLDMVNTLIKNTTENISEEDLGKLNGLLNKFMK